MRSPWPRPQHLVAPELLEALSAALAGEIDTAQRVLRRCDARDPLAADVVRLTRGLVALERGSESMGRRLLRPLLRHEDAAIALHATLALAESHVRARRFTRATPLLTRALEHATDAGARLMLETALLRVELLRRGAVAAERVDALPKRLHRKLPPAAHAAVHLLQGEAALTLGDLRTAVASERRATAWVRTAGSARLARQHETLATLLEGAPFAEVEDWQQPRRALSRGEVAALLEADWQVWIDFLHLRLATRSAAPKTVTVHFGSRLQLWDVLAAIVRSPRRRLGYAALQKTLECASLAETAQRLAALCEYLERCGASGVIVDSGDGGRLQPERYVCLDLARAIPSTQRLLLAQLAEKPGARARDLADRLQVPQRTLVRHLAELRRSGFVRLVGGGRESRYQLV